MREVALEVNVRGQDPETLKLTLELIYADNGPTDWGEKDNSLILYPWHQEKTIPFPAQMKIDALLPTVQAWLEKRKPFEKAYNGDGSSSKGFEIKIDRDTNTVEIKPVWIYYGK